MHKTRVVNHKNYGTTQYKNCRRCFVKISRECACIFLKICIYKGVYYEEQTRNDEREEMGGGGGIK